MMGFWILTSVRCGSWHLAELLNRTGLFDPPFDEYLHWNMRYSGIPQNCKVIRRHFISRFNDCDRQMIESKIGGLKYVILERSDVFARAVSLYFAVATGQWQMKEMNDKHVPFNKEAMLQAYVEVCDPRFNSWKSYTDVIRVKYDDLISDPSKLLNTVLEEWDLPTYDFDIEPSKTMRRPETDTYIDRLRDLVRQTPELPEPSNMSGDIYSLLATILK